MNKSKTIILSIYFAFLTLIVGIITIPSIILRGKKGLSNLSQVFEIWKVLLKTLFNTTKNKIHKLHLKGQAKKHYKKDYLSINLSEIDFFLFIYIGYMTLYFGLLIYIIIMTLIAIITYKAIYVSPIATDISQKPTPDIIVYEKSKLEINRDTYCPCVTIVDLPEDQLKQRFNTLIYNEDSTLVEISANHLLTDEDFSKSNFEHNPLIKHSVNENGYLVHYDSYDFYVNEKQGFVFSYDLSSLYYISNNKLFKINLEE